MKRNRFTVALILAAAAWRGAGQTAVDLSRQGKLGAGTALPAKCAVGQVFLKTDAPAGANLYACTTTDTWTAMGVLNLTGDVSGSQQSSTVQAIQGRSVSNSAPTDRSVLRWNAATSTWEPGAVPSTGTTAPPASCASGSFYLQNDAANNIHQLYVCSDTNTWAMASLRSGTAGARPVGCVLGQTWLSTDTGGLTYCSATGTPGTWSALAGSGGGSSNPSNGPRNTVQVSDGTGGFVGYSGVSSDGAKLSVAVPAQMSGLSSEVNGSSTMIPDANYHRGVSLSYRTAAEGLNFGFASESGVSSSLAAWRGWNDDIGGQNKYTVMGMSNYAHSPASGQRFGFGNTLNCLGMGDCYGTTQTVTQYGGLNADGDEGTGQIRNSLSQGNTLIQAHIASVPAQSHCTGYFTQDVARSSGGAAQAVNFTRTSAAGTCLKDEWIDMDRGPVYMDAHHEVAQLTADYNAGKLSAIFQNTHANGVAVVPAMVLTLDNTYLFGELRYLVNLTTPRHAGTIAAISGRQFTISDTIAANVVGGDSTLPGIVYFDQDNYTGPPFYSSNDLTTLHSFYAINALQDGSNFSVAHKGPVGQMVYSGKAQVGGGYHILGGARVWRVFEDGRVVLENNSFSWTAGDQVENAISVDGVVSNSNFVSWYTPGATLYDAFQISNLGARAFESAINIAGRMVGTPDADSIAFGTGIALSAPSGTALAIGKTTTSAISIGPNAAQGSSVNSNIQWFPQEALPSSIGPSGNTLAPGSMVINGGVDQYPKGHIIFTGEGNALGNNFGSTPTYQPQILLGGNVMAWTKGGPAWLGIIQGSDDTHFNGWRMEYDANANNPTLSFHYIYTSGAGNTSETYPFSVGTVFGGWSGPTAPKSGTATSTTNYGSSAFGLQGSMWHAGGARNVGALLDITPESGGADAAYDFRIKMYDPVNNNLSFPNTALWLSSSGVLTIGLYNDGYGPDHRATLDPSGLTAHRSYTLPDGSGALAVSGIAQPVSFGTISAGGFLQGTSAPPTVNATSCTGAAIGSGSTNLAGTITGLPNGSCSVTLTFSSANAAHGWSCSVSNQTTSNLFREMGSTANSITFNGTSASGDVLSYGPCAAY